MADRPRRVSVGFYGAQVLALRLAQGDLDGLLGALEQGGWHRVAAEEGEVTLNLAQVIYVRVENEEQRIGF